LTTLNLESNQIVGGEIKRFRDIMRQKKVCE